MDGLPVDGASIVYIPRNGGRPFGARTGVDGRYVVLASSRAAAIFPGEYLIRISTKSDAYQDKDGRSIPASKETIPARYNQDSTLLVEIKDAVKNVVEINLTSE